MDERDSGLTREPPEPDGPTSAHQLSEGIRESLLGGGELLSLSELAERARTTPTTALKFWRSLGFPLPSGEERIFTDQDVAMLGRIIDRLRAGDFSLEATLSTARSFGHNVERMVVWEIETLVDYLAHRYHVDDHEARRLLLHSLPSQMSDHEAVVLYTWRRHMAAAVGRLAEDLRDPEDPEGPGQMRAVGFADLVSYTQLVNRLSQWELARLVQRFEYVCSEVLSGAHGTLVKSVGDEVVFLADSPRQGAELALRLRDKIMRDELLPEVRVTFVWGSVVMRLGDVFGPTVNLAARLKAAAEPGTVVSDQRTAEELRPASSLVLKDLQPHRIKDFGVVTPVMVDRSE